MRNLLLLLVLANVLYFIWEMVIEEPPERGVAILTESELGPPLKLASKADASTTLATGMPSASRQTDLAAAVGRSCVSIGPFTNSPDAERVYQEYRQEDMRASVRSTEGELFVGHWVQIRNVPDRETGNLMLERLTAGGIPDAYLVPTDDEGLKISLGLFGEMSRAERVELQAEALNLPAEIAPRMREATVFYVDIALPPGQGAGAIIRRYGEDMVLLREKATCPRSG